MQTVFLKHLFTVYWFNIKPHMKLPHYFLIIKQRMLIKKEWCYSTIHELAWAWWWFEEHMKSWEQQWLEQRVSLDDKEWAKFHSSETFVWWKLKIRLPTKKRTSEATASSCDPLMSYVQLQEGKILDFLSLNSLLLFLFSFFLPSVLWEAVKVWAKTCWMLLYRKH